MHGGNEDDDDTGKSPLRLLLYWGVNFINR